MSFKAGDRVVHVDEDRTTIGTVVSVEGEPAGKPSGWVEVAWDQELVHEGDLVLVLAP